MVSLRKFPHPYKSMIGVHSDIDWTGYDKISEIMTFLNTEEETPLGTGIGLPLTTSVIAVSDLSTAGIFNHTTDKTDIELVSQAVDGQDWVTETLPDYIDKGWVDFLHSMAASGNEAYTNSGWQPFQRAWAQKYLDWTIQTGKKLEYNINHSSSTSNIITVNDHNSQPLSPMRWVDLAVQAGIRFFEIGNSGVGRNYNQLNTAGSIIYPVTFADGTKSWGFNRAYVATPAANNIDIWCNPSKLEEITNNGVMDIIGIHWGYWHDGGYIRNPSPKIPQNSIDALKLLRNYQDAGRILVARTRNILQFDLAKRVAKWEASRENGNDIINITSFDDTQFSVHTPVVDEVRGLTFYVNNSQTAEIRIAGTLVDESEIVRNEADQTGQQSIGIVWHEYTPPPNYSPEEIPREFINIRMQDEFVKIPVYSVEGRNLKVMTPNGVGGLDIVGVENTRASGIYINTVEGVRSIAKSEGNWI